MYLVAVCDSVNYSAHVDFWDNVYGEEGLGRKEKKKQRNKESKGKKKKNKKMKNKNKCRNKNTSTKKKKEENNKDTIVTHFFFFFPRFQDDDDERACDLRGCCNCPARICGGVAALCVAGQWLGRHTLLFFFLFFFFFQKKIFVLIYGSWPPSQNFDMMTVKVEDLQFSAPFLLVVSKPGKLTVNIACLCCVLYVVCLWRKM